MHITRQRFGSFDASVLLLSTSLSVGKLACRRVVHGLLELNQVLVSREFLTPPCLWHLY